MAPSALAPDPQKLRAIELATSLDRQIIDAPPASWRTVKLALRRQTLPYYWNNPPPFKLLLRLMNPQARMRPAFLSIGPARSGTTLLADYIMQHPCVALPLAKEFAVTTYPTLKLIDCQFPTLAQQRKLEKRYGKAVTGYCSPVIPNLMFPHVLQGLEGSQDLRFVVILRNPVDRTWAHWRWEKLVSRRASNPLWRGLPDFAETIRIEIEAAKLSAASGGPLYSGSFTGGYIQNSVYLPFLKQLHRFWDRSQTLIINAGDFFSDPAATARRVYGFLDLPDYEPVELPVRNAGPRGRMDDDARGMLEDFFGPLNKQLFDYLGEDFGWNGPGDYTDRNCRRASSA